MKQLDVQILHQNYLLSCPEGHEERLLEAVDRVNDTMGRIRDAGKVRSRERVAVLAALNMAFDIVTLERRPAPAAAEPEPVPETSAEDEAWAQAAMIQQQADAQRIVALLERLDQALEADAQLL
ncbi:cell division protein ZapA [Comamonas antarctica]|uniref:Cell division protein ZapA n=1 Tax=Comamonas antarctica TaxID=2743470 RepID=A0A6N1X2B2_9BURK|nr:cell division protein ZapA [Comamonas antarctica]QKV53594.1 cell division protein ZapA [Comamonas antarctica]